jgi:outer membrane protein assembly factor BamB
VAAFSNGQLQAYKASTGTPLWSEWLVSGSATESLSDITAVKANPIIDSEAVYAVGYNTPLVAIETRTGVKLWQKDIAASSQPWIAGKFIFVLTTDGDLVALDKTNGKIIWTAIIPYNSDEDKLGIFTSGPLLANDALLVASSNGKLFSVSPYNGRIMGVADIEEGVETTPILVNETLILTTNDAEMTAYK